MCVLVPSSGFRRVDSPCSVLGLGLTRPSPWNLWDFFGSHQEWEEAELKKVCSEIKALVARYQVSPYLSVPFREVVYASALHRAPVVWHSFDAITCVAVKCGVPETWWRRL